MARPKLQDIAKEANCSIATVSYVLNNKKDQKISSETRIKILQVASLMGYNKNTFAQALASGRTNHIGIYVGTPCYGLTKDEVFDALNILVSKLHELDYFTTLLPSNYDMFLTNVDAIICISLSDDDFKTVAKYNTVPVIALDTRPHVDWVFSVVSTYKNTVDKCALKDEDYTLVCNLPNSTYIRTEILKNNPNTIFISHPSNLVPMVDNLKDKTVISSSDQIATLLSMLGIKSLKYPVDLNKKITKVIECIRQSLTKEKFAVHVFDF